MLAVQLTDYGSVDNFRIADLPLPQPKAKEVRIKVEFAGLRWGDIMARHGIKCVHKVDSDYFFVSEGKP